MRRGIAVALVTVVAVAGGSALPAGAAKKPKPRTFELAYSEPAIGAAGAGVCLQGSSCLFFGPPAGKEKFFSVEIEDSSGLPAPASVIQDTNGDGNFLVTDDLTVGICGATTEPIEIEPGKDVSVWVWRAGANPPCPGTASSGMATATFSATP
ncbi:MAG: hypothetical protein M3273_10255 [Actinomycetota bacterium]|nr:hypothetical protein [Actinomycetota bacterium]